MPSPTTVLLRTQSDERLVALAQSGHERAFEAIVERYRRPLLRACRRVLPEARAEDAVQQALVAAWNGISRGDDVRDLRPWLYRIAHNTALNQLRVSGYDYDELSGLLAAGPAADEELERREIARRTLAGLAALPERQRDALLAIAVQGRGQDEVARGMGISETAVRQLVHRARTHLRSAATALTPMPLAVWWSDAGGLAGGAGAAGATATVAKLGAVIVLAGGAAAGTTGVVDRLGHGSRGATGAAVGRIVGAADAQAAEPAPTAAAEMALPAGTPAPPRPIGAPRASAPAPARLRTIVRRDTSSPAEHESAPVVVRRSDDGGRRSGSSGSSGGRSGGSDDGPSTPTLAPTSGDDDAAPTRDGSGDGSSGDGSSGSSGSSGSGDGGFSGGSGSSDGGSDDSSVVPTVTPTATPESSGSPEYSSEGDLVNSSGG